MFGTKKTKKLKTTRFVDGLFIWPKKIRTKERRYWRLLFLIPVLACLLIFGKLSAYYVLPSINLISLFREGKFLVLFQNNSELRSSGGFIGSYATVTVKNFEVQNISFNTNIYALDNAFTKANHIAPPKPIVEMLKVDNWALRDSNYNASFDAAAKDITRFYEAETGDKIDGIVAVNAGLMIDLLKITGPIRLDKYNLTISADNFYEETQTQVEKTYFENPENRVLNEPKAFLKDLYPLILSNALKEKKQLFNLLKDKLTRSEVLFYFTNSAKQTLLEKHNLAGKIPTGQDLKDMFATSGDIDYIYINSNSYSGNKSSLSIKEDVSYKLTATDDYGPKMSKADLKISRIHTGTYDWPDGKNLEWERVFVPLTAQFLNATINGQDISSVVEVGKDAGKAYFGLKVETAPGQANILEINYLLPYTSNYHLFVQKQPGRTDALNVNVNGKLLFDGVLDRNRKF